MKLVVDMSLSPALAMMLTSGGHDAVHWSAVGPANAPDFDIMAWAAANNCIIITHDLDFGDLLYASGATKPSVIILREHDPHPERITEPLLLAFERFNAELAAGALIAMTLNMARIRSLPLG
jgi:predicted nuclease of predicted toxin-antitoxin system